MIERAHIQVTENGTSLATKKLATLGATAKGSSMAFNGLARSVVGLMKAYVGLRSVIGAVKVIKEFDTTMLEVQAVTQATTKDFERLTASAREMGATTRYSASQAGEALLQLSRNGFNVNQAMTALPDTLNLAIAGVMGLEQASDIASITVKQFGLQAKDVKKVGDILVKTANTSAQTVSQMADGMKYAGVVAGALNKPLEETAGAMGVLANAGIRGSMAGTQLRQIFLRLASPSESAKKAFEEMGLTEDEVSTKTHSLVEIFKKFKKAGMDASQSNAIFSFRAVAGALALSKYNDEFKDFVDANYEAQGVAKKTADIMDSGLNAKWLIFKSTLQEVALQMGDSGFKGVLENVVQTLTETTRIVFGFKGALDDASTSAKVLAGIIGALAGMQVIKAFSTLRLVIIGISTAVKGLVLSLTPLTGTALIIGAIIGALYMFRDATVNVGVFAFRLGDIFTGVWNVIKDLAVKGWKVFKEFAMNIYGSAKEIGSAWWDTLSVLGTNFQKFFASLNIKIDWSVFKQFVNDMINAPIAIVRAFGVAFADISILIAEFLIDLSKFGEELGKRLYVWSENIGKWNTTVWDAITVGFTKGKNPADTGRIIGEMLAEGFAETKWEYPTDELDNMRKEMGTRLGKNASKIQADVTKQLTDQMSTDIVGNSIFATEKVMSMIKASVLNASMIKDKGQSTGVFGEDIVAPDFFVNDSIIGSEVKEKTVEDLREITQAGQIIVDSFSNNISNSLYNMFTGVETSFGELIQSIVQDIMRAMTSMYVKMFFEMMMKGISNIGSGSGNSFSIGGGSGGGGQSTLGKLASTLGSGLGMFNNSGGLFGGGFAFGGNFKGGIPRRTNEYSSGSGIGEIDVPSYSGRVLSRQDSMKAVEGRNDKPIGVTILNQVDDNVILDVMNKSAGKRMIINTISNEGLYGR